MKKEREKASICYDHLSGILGEKLFIFFIENKWIEKEGRGRDFIITKKGYDEFNKIGIDKEKLINTKRKIIATCIERSGEKYFEHTGAYIGSLLMEKFIEMGLISKGDGKKINISEEGIIRFNEMGIIL